MTRLEPWEFPLQRFGSIRSVASRVTARAVRGALGMEDAPLILIAYPRASLDLVRALEPDLVAYHAIDDYSETLDGVKDTAFLDWEERMLRLANLTVAITTPLADRLRSSGCRNLVVIPLGFDEESIPGIGAAPSSEVVHLPRPILGFIGTIRADRLDMEMLHVVARHFAQGTVLFVGTEFDNRSGDLRSLRGHPNVRFLGSRPRDGIPSILASLDVAICPYRNCRVNLGCYPLKVVDALAAGKPAVFAPPRSDLVELAPVARYAGTPLEFVRQIEEALSEGCDSMAAERRRKAVIDLGWERLAQRFLSEVEAALERPGGTP
jgi:glycosyltransferase involved in cell wall biosynthesis